MKQVSRLIDFDEYGDLSKLLKGRMRLDFDMRIFWDEDSIHAPSERIYAEHRNIFNKMLCSNGEILLWSFG